ncbi:MAG: hypothetical protein KAV00_11050 [Phycisphaerae bacterium]|nr:hypothetical protein [Phycisphaerae bacterium]
MITEKYQWLASIIGAHPDHQLIGRTRLQKTVWLLQRLGAPMEYEYRMYFYGPYSEGVQSDIGLLEQLKLVEEAPGQSADGSPYYAFSAREQAVSWAESEEVKKYQDSIQLISGADPVVLELAATYEAFREMGYDHEDAMERLRRKKGSKCDEGRDDLAINLLYQLGLREIAD